jgi:hypothetical protein
MTCSYPYFESSSEALVCRIHVNAGAPAKFKLVVRIFRARGLPPSRRDRCDTLRRQENRPQRAEISTPITGESSLSKTGLEAERRRRGAAVVTCDGHE